MGKAYQKELQNLYSTYDWAITVPINELRSFVRASWSLPLLSIGSGGARASLLLNSDFNRFYSTTILPSKHRDT